MRSASRSSLPDTPSRLGAPVIAPVVSRSLGALACAVAFTAFAPSAAWAVSPYGVWIDHTGRGAVEVKKCGSRLCGIIVWARKRADMKRGCGRKLLGGLSQVGRTSWDRGWIIAPDSGTKYDLAIRPLSRNKLEITGYAGSKLFSKTMVWTRAPSNLKRCDEPEKPPQVLAKAEKPRPSRPLGVGGPGVPLIPETALRKPVTTAPAMTRVAVAPARPPMNAPLPTRKPTNMLAQLALETSGLEVGRPQPRDKAVAVLSPVSDVAILPPIVPPRPRVAQRPVQALASIDDRLFLEAVRPEPAKLMTCRITAPFVVSSIPCAR